jgi:hypothetical protein
VLTELVTQPGKRFDRIATRHQSDLRPVSLCTL